MNNEIKYSGFSAEPSDYECPDGSLAASTNLVCEDSQIKPIFAPKTMMRFVDNGKLVLIHHVPNHDNFIIQRGNALYWMPQPDPENYSAELTDNSAVLIKDFDTINTIAIVGNTLVVASNSLEYILWKDNSYHPLGSKPPFINIEFGCQKVGTLNNQAEMVLSTERSAGGFIRPQAEEANNAVFGLMLPAISEKVTSRGYFYMPFFVRYAYRLYDGSYCWHSAPILMLPSVIKPQVLTTGAGTYSDGLLTINSQLNIPYFQLNYKISGIDNLQDWEDIVTAIDIFITAPIYTYNQSGDVGYNSSNALELSSGYFDYYANYYDPRTGRFSSVDYYFSGHYADRGSNLYVDHKIKSPTIEEGTYRYAWGMPANEQFHEQIKSCNGGNFYKVASLPLKTLELVNEFKLLPLESSEMDNLVNRERLPDEYQSHHNMNANTALTYNNRLCITNLSMLPPVPFPLASCVEASSTPQGLHPTNVQIEVYSRINGVICHNINPDSTLGNSWDMEQAFPRYIYYPDSTAYKMNLRYGGSDHFVDLVPHDFLNGAYYYGSLLENGKPSVFATPESQTPETSVNLANKIYVSEINNPFVFPAQNIVTVGNGVVSGLASAAKALSQGQFGQFPLYAFTTEGVWALEVSSTGTFSARQPISRDVCLDAKSITPIDSSVLFATKRGIMQISGSQTTCISDIIKSETPFNVLHLPHLNELHRSIPGHPQDNCIPAIPFTEFLQGCGMIYDYIAQRIVVYNPNSDYAYVFSLKSQQWGLMLSQFSSSLPSYPYAYAVTSLRHTDTEHNFLVDLNNTDQQTSHGLLVTRPIKLVGDGVNADMLKTINTVIQRGFFAHGHVQSVLYGSRDLKNWFAVWSSKDHSLRGFSGSPYKYFRIALLTSLCEGESIFGASIALTPKFNNKLI